MKFFNISTLILFIALFSNCSHEENVTATQNLVSTDNTGLTAKIPSGIYTDAIFVDYIKATYDDSQLVKDVSKLESYVADNTLSSTELVDIHAAFGYSTYKDLEDFTALQASREEYLESTYKISSLTLAEQQEIFVKGFEMNISDYSGKNSCYWRVQAETVLYHLGCVAGDFTVIVGILCHGAVEVYHYNALKACNK